MVPSPHDRLITTLGYQSSFQTRRREADIGSRANARFLDIGFVPEADAQHPTLSPEKSSLNSCFSMGNSHSICESSGRNLAEGLCSQRRKLLTPKRRARNTPTSFSRFAKENQVRPAKLDRLTAWRQSQWGP